MGHLINPISFRLGASKHWNSLWSVNSINSNYISYNSSDLNVFMFFKKFFTLKFFRFSGFILSHIKISRELNNVSYIIYLFNGAHLHLSMITRKYLTHSYNQKRFIVKIFFISFIFYNKFKYFKFFFSNFSNFFKQLFLYYVLLFHKSFFVYKFILFLFKFKNFFKISIKLYNYFFFKKLFNFFINIFSIIDKYFFYCCKYFLINSSYTIFFNYFLFACKIITIILKKFLFKFSKKIFFNKKQYKNISLNYNYVYNFFLYNFIILYKINYYIIINRKQRLFRFFNYSQLLKKYNFYYFPEFIYFNNSFKIPFEKYLKLYCNNFVTFFKHKTQTLYLKCLNPSQVNATIVSQYIIYRLKQRFRLQEVLFPVIKHLTYNKFVRGFKITCAGRFTKKEIATYDVKSFLSVPFSSICFWLDYNFSQIILKYSVCGIKVFLHRRYLSKKKLIKYILKFGKIEFSKFTKKYLYYNFKISSKLKTTISFKLHKKYNI